MNRTIPHFPIEKLEIRILARDYHYLWSTEYVESLRGEAGFLILASNLCSGANLNFIRESKNKGKSLDRESCLLVVQIACGKRSF